MQCIVYSFHAVSCGYLGFVYGGRLFATQGFIANSKKGFWAPDGNRTRNLLSSGKTLLSYQDSGGRENATICTGPYARHVHVRPYNRTRNLLISERLLGDQKIAGSISVSSSETFFWVCDKDWVENSFHLIYQAASHLHIYIYLYMIFQTKTILGIGHSSFFQQLLLFWEGKWFVLGWERIQVL